jgi:MtN3 and saliva related transmembrane protein
MVFFEGLSLSILAIVAGIMILAGWVPQIIKGYKTKKLDDISKYLMILVAGGAFLWILYGIEKDDPFIIGVNVAAIVLTMIVLSMKFRYERKNKIDTSNIT